MSLTPSLALDFSAFEGMNWDDERAQKPMLNSVFTWAPDLVPNLAPSLVSGFSPFLVPSFAPFLAPSFFSKFAPSLEPDFVPSLVPKM